MNRSIRNAAALAALVLPPTLAAKPACAQQALPPALLATDITVTEFAARRPLSAQERAQVVAIDQAQFRRDPAWSLQTLRREITDVKNLRRMDPVRLAEWRQSNLVSAVFRPDPHCTPGEYKTLLAIYTVTNPIVAVDPATKTVVTEKDIDAWAAAARLLAQKSGAPLQVDPRPMMLEFVHAPVRGKQSAAQHISVANMERDWTAYRLGWSHEPARIQQLVTAPQIRRVKQGAAKGDALRVAALSALNLTDFAYGDYPYLLSPGWAVSRPKFMARMEAATRMIYMHSALRNLQNMRNYNAWAIGENGRMYRNSARLGESPAPGDEVSKPLPLPAP